MRQIVREGEGKKVGKECDRTRGGGTEGRRQAERSSQLQLPKGTWSIPLSATQNLTTLERRALGGDVVLPLTVRRWEGTSLPKVTPVQGWAWPGPPAGSSLVLSPDPPGSKVSIGLVPGLTKAFLPFFSFFRTFLLRDTFCFPLCKNFTAIHTPWGVNA